MIDQPKQSGIRKTMVEVNKELVLVFSMFLIAGVLNFAFDSQRMVLGFYALPTIFSAYMYGRRHAVLTAFASIFLVIAVTFYPQMLQNRMQIVSDSRWFDIAEWGGILVIMAYAMGSLYERMQFNMRELQESYQGLLMILQHMASDNRYQQNHPYRVSVCATKIAEQMRLSPESVEAVRAAALLHDIDKVGVSHEMLYKAAHMTYQEYEQVQKSIEAGQEVVVKEGGSPLRRVIPVIIAYNAAMEKGTDPKDFSKSPLETRILTVADVYDSLTSDRQSGVSPSEAMQVIHRRAATEFDPEVVEALLEAFNFRLKETETVTV